MSDESRPRTDEEFTTNHLIDFKPANDWAEDFNIYVYEPVTGRESTWINVEFREADGNITDAYFHPEDLERLGILFQYLGKTAREKRDGDG